MSYQVLARKWRPKNFNELLGQNSARQTLTNALSKGRLYPVLIFTGPRGTGKTSTARIVAKSLRCQNKNSNDEPCEKCEDCLSISNSCHLDVIEIDGASNNGVEAVRELRDKVSYMPSSGEWKIYIIDEVHMLSNSAFNALLKTLEEPPKHVVFIMATTESHKIPPTVLSRCQKIDFHLLSPLVIKNQLEKICEKEAFPITENLLWILARQAEGSLRDAQSLLDQVITFCGAEAKEEEVRRLLGLSDPQILEDTLKALILGEEIKILSMIAKLRQKSSPPKAFLESLLSSVSHLLFLKKNPSNSPPLLPLSQEEIERRKELISFISYEQLHFLFDMLLKGEREMSLSHDSELVLEVLLLRVCSALQIEQMIPFSPKNQSSSKSLSKKTPSKLSPAKKNSDKEDSKFISDPHSKPQTPLLSSKLSPKNSSLSSSQSQKPQSFFPKTSSSEPAQSKKPLSKTPNLKTPFTDSNPSSLDGSSQSPALNPKESSFENRLEFLDHLKKKDPLLGSLIDQLSFKRTSQLEFIISIPKPFSYLKKKLEQPYIKNKLEQELSLFLKLNQKARFLYQLEESLEQNLKQEKEKQEREELLKKAEENPFIQDMKQVFKGKIRSVKRIDKEREEL